jgi:predicted ATP-binding protein involved in virulence
MRIEHVRLLNYRCHQRLELKFSSAFNVLVGVNGSGKTSLLKAVADALNGLFIGVSAPQHLYMDEPDSARLAAATYPGGIRFEPHYPISVTAVGEAFGKKCQWEFKKASSVDHSQVSGAIPGQLWTTMQQQADSASALELPSISLPVIAFYRANRSWRAPQPHELTAATQKVSRTHGYKNWWDASTDSTALQSWAIAKCLERFQTSSETGRLFDDIRDDELALVNTALSNAIEGVTGLRYDLRYKSLFIEWAENANNGSEATPFENLSDGQSAVICLVADIARRMCLLNPQLGQEVIRKTNGIVLIDELDVHLHPTWQRKLTTALKTAFPAVEFIAASHSPQVLGELKPEEIILLHPDGESPSHPQVSYGLTSSEVLEVIMGAAPRSPEVSDMLSKLFQAVERNDLEAARTYLIYVRKISPDIPELDGAEALLRRKELIGR